MLASTPFGDEGEDHCVLLPTGRKRTMTAAEKWRRELLEWAIPEHIVEQAPTSPWIHPPVLFDLPESLPLTTSHERAREALGDDASMLDLGCGGGIATFALGDAVRRGVGVDHQQAMLGLYERNGRSRNIDVVTVLGDWPEVAAGAPICDVVAIHHVVYNVADIGPFLDAAQAHARHRVVIELPTRHPLSTMSAAWRHFWNLERPEGPTPLTLLEVLEEQGCTARCEFWSGEMRGERDLDQAAHFMRIRLCLPQERQGEVREFLGNSPQPTSRELATIWWDVP